jgi:nicotinate (nicotinamide) nucleotide adenylyltransferase
MYYNGLVRDIAIRYGILPGAFHPPTAAHLALAEAALTRVDQVVFVLPRSLPHKQYSAVSFETRLQLLRAATSGNSRFAVAATAGGLLIEIARELRSTLPTNSELHFLCGRDAAERIVSWDYGTPGAFDSMLREFHLLVAPRGGEYVIPDQHRHAIATLPLAEEYQAMSATDVRERIRKGAEWRHLVPPSIQQQVLAIYGSQAGHNR